MNPRTALVTAGSGGIGGHVTRALARAGWRVLFAGRDERHGKEFERELAGQGSEVRFLRADLSSQSGVEHLTVLTREALGNWGTSGLDVLVNALGAVYATRQLTADGVEATLALNYLHPLLLSCLLYPELAARGGRVIQFGTGYHHLVRLTEADWAGRRWDCGMNVYGRAKLISVLAGQVLGERWKAGGVGVHFADPGMADTPLTRSMGREAFPWYGRFLVPLIRFGQRRVSSAWNVSSTLRLALPRRLSASTGLYALPGPWLLPGFLVGFDAVRGRRLLDESPSLLLPEYREIAARRIGGLA